MKFKVNESECECSNCQDCQDIDRFIQAWLENDEHTLSKPYILRRIWNQILDIRLGKKNNIADLLRKGGERRSELMELLRKYRKEEILEETIELTEYEVEELKEMLVSWEGLTLQELEWGIDRIRKTSYSRRLKEFEKYYE